MKTKILFLFIFATSISLSAQKKLDELLKELNTESVPYITVEELAKENPEDIILLDSREKKEFKTSHIQHAIFAGYDFFNLKKTTKKLKDKNQKIVVYCSLGVRSEDVAEKLKEAGYTNVYNLYGGIFEWKNKSQDVVDKNDKPTEKVHTFSKEWSQWLNKGEKVYEN